ncbi:beta-glucosidase 5 [Phyllosticta citrichinensis]|uniref:Probable beta-glucosidase btgE n=1 Tax=Phyllosticta citrichinensis TaxID=1130410 RepID=A0ABR1Y227_9PEZI
MKSALLAVAAGALLGNTAAAHGHDGHQSFHQRRQPGQLELRDAADECVCSTYVTTVTGPPQLVTQTQVVPPASSTPAVTPSTEALSSTPAASSSVPDNVPTPFITTYATPGTYTIPARTVTLTEVTTVPVVTTQTLTSGVNTYGGVTTSVVTETTVTCPYATVETSGSTTTSVIKTTSYYCPGNGVYTVVPPVTTTVPADTTADYPKVTSYTPGTYTQPERTVTITKTNDVYTCPVDGTESTATGPISASSAVGGASATPSSSAPVANSATPTPTPTPALTGSAQGSASTPSASPSTSANGGNGMTTNGNQWAITYTPYNSDGTCKTADDVKTDIADIKDKGFTTVRLYATDCDGLVNVGAACSESALKMIIGIYIKSDGISAQDTQDQVTEIQSWAKEGSNWDLVDMIVIGNEAVFNGWATAQELGEFISTVKSTFKSAGLASKAFTTSETVNIVQQESFNTYICPAIDVIGVNVQPFFDGNTAAEDAGDFVVSQLGLASKACPSHSDVTEVFNLESGWPHQSSTNNAKAIAGTSEQATAIKSIIEKAGTHSVLFSYGDDTWKEGGEWGVEGYFGCAEQIELISGELKIGGLTISASISSEGIDVDVDLDF